MSRQDLSHLSEQNQKNVREGQTRGLHFAKEIVDRCERENRKLTKAENEDYDEHMARGIEIDKRPPSNLVFLIDVSGSMRGEAWASW